MGDHFPPTNGSSFGGDSGGGGLFGGRDGGGAVNSASSSSPSFHTPEQQEHQQHSASSSRKRSSSEFRQGSSGGSGSGGSNGNEGGWSRGLGRLFTSLTPWKRTSTGTKRPRTSLDDMSGSAIKRLVNRTEDDDDNNGEEEYMDDKAVGEGRTTDYEGEENSGYVSDGVKASGTKLGKLNLEAKFDGSEPTDGNESQRRNTSFVGVQPPQQGRGGSMARTQQLQQPEKQLQQQQSLVQGGSYIQAASASSEMPMKKRVRIHDEIVTDADVQSPYYHSTSGRMNNNSNIPKFHSKINGRHLQQHKSPIPLRNVHGRKSTPAGKFAASSSASPMSMQQRLGHSSSAGSTPGLRKMGGTQLPSSEGAGSLGEQRMFHMGTTTSNYAPSTTLVQRRSTVAPKRSLQRFNYHHRSINARSYKPMSHLLTGANNFNGMSSTDGEKSMMLTKSIVSQIVAENQNQLLLAANDAGGDSGLLFGGQKIVATTKRNARENAEEVARLIAGNAGGTSAGIAVPRVRMTRILGSGQTGGRWHVTPEEEQPDAYLPESDAADRTTAKVATERMVKYQVAPGMIDTTMEDDSKNFPADAESKFLPYNAAILTPRVTKSGKQLTPCKCELSMEEGLEIERWINSEEFKQEAKVNRLGFDDPAIYSPPKSTSPRKKGKRQCTPYPKKKIADALATSSPGVQRADEEITSSVPSIAVSTLSGAPFHFMSGGAAASSVVHTPMAFKFLDKESAPVPSPPATSFAPPAEASPAQGERSDHLPTTPSGWGNLFPPIEPGVWKCASCNVQNPKEASHCLSCKTAREPSDNSGTGATTKNNEPSVNAMAGSIGAEGFTFGGEPSSSAGTTSSSVVATVSNPFTPKTNSTSKVIHSFSGGLGDLFKLKPGEWKCGKCTCKNSANDSKCGDCGTPREGGEDKKTSVGIDDAASVIPKPNLSAEMKTGIGVGGFSFAGTSLPNSGGAISSGGFSFAGATANSTSTTPAKPKRVRLEASDDDVSNQTPASSAGFTFGATATPLGDEKKEDPVNSAAASDAGDLFFGAGAVAAEKKDTIKPTSTFSFGLAPQPNRLATDTIGKKDETFAPSSKRAMFSLGKGGESATKGDSTPSTHTTIPFGNMTASTKPADTPAPLGATKSEPSINSAISFRGKVTDSTSAPAPASLFSFGASADTADMKKDASALSGQSTVSFGPTPSAASVPSTQNNGKTSVALFSFGAPAPAASSTLGSTFAFSSSAPSTSTPALSTSPLPSATAGSMFGAVSNPPAFGTMSGGFGSAGQSSAPAPVPTAPGTTFSFGMGSTSTPATGRFGTTTSFGFGSAPPQPMAPTPITGTFGMNVVPTPTPGFAGDQAFGAQSTVMGGFNSQSTSGGGGVGSFSIGIGDTKGAGGSTRGAAGIKRRILKAKRPPPQN